MTRYIEMKVFSDSPCSAVGRSLRIYNNARSSAQEASEYVQRFLRLYNVQSKRIKES